MNVTISVTRRGQSFRPGQDSTRQPFRTGRSIVMHLVMRSPRVKNKAAQSSGELRCMTLAVGGGESGDSGGRGAGVLLRRATRRSGVCGVGVCEEFGNKIVWIKFWIKGLGEG